MGGIGEPEEGPAFGIRTLFGLRGYIVLCRSDEMATPSERKRSIGQRDPGTIRSRKARLSEQSLPVVCRNGRLGIICNDNCPPGQVNEEFLRLLARPINQLMVGLVEIRKQASVAAADTCLSLAIPEQRRITGGYSFIDALEMHEVECLAGHPVECT